MTGVLEFFKTAEKLHSEARTTQLSNGEKESVSSHTWMMNLMAIIFSPRLRTPVNIERVLKLCTVHDLAESIVHDIPLHEQVKNKNVCKTKHDCELTAIKQMALWINNCELMELWSEYEARQTPESKFVKQLDLLDVDLQVMCSQTLDYVGEYDNGIYWKLYFSTERIKPFENEPVLKEFFLTIQARIESRLQNELNIDPDIYKDQV